MGMFDGEAQNSDELGTAGLSFAGARRGLTVSGIILPNADLGISDNEAYRRVQDYDNAGNPKFYPHKEGRPDRPIYRIEFLLKTDLTDWAQTSTKFESRALQDFPDTTDDGVRRWICGAQYMSDAIKDALARLGREPEVGGKLTVKVTGHSTGKIQRGPNAGEDFTRPVLEVNWEPATAEGKRVAEAYRAEHFAKEQATGGMFGGTNDDSVPPF